MKNFLIKLIIFLIPVLAVFMLPITVYILGREYYSTEQAINKQTIDSKILYGTAYSSPDSDYKQKLFTNINPVVAVVGSSRSLGFRKDFFAKPDKFFVAGTGGNRQAVESLGEIVKNATSTSDLRFIIFTIDPSEFILKPEMTTKNNLSSENESKLLNFISSNWKKVYLDYFVYDKFTLIDLMYKSKKSEDIGLLAILNRDGYRTDGGYQYTKIKQDSNHIKNLQLSIDEELESIKNNGNFSEYGDQISSKKINALNETLKLCKEKNIYVIGVSTPRPTKILKALKSPGYTYSDMFNSLPIKLGQVFTENGFEYYDLSDFTILEGNDNEFRDWIHPSDKLYLRMTIYLSEKNQQLRKYTDLKELNKMLKNTKGDFLDSD